MNIGVIEFFTEEINCEEFVSKSVLEVGSKYVNGSIRPLIEKFCKPKQYVGVDIEQGKYVDKVVPADKLSETFGKDNFDVVITTEMLEHVKNWKIIVKNLKEVLMPNGYIYITTRSLGFGYHAYPYDFWRYEIEDMAKIFSDFKIISLKKDSDPGVLLKAQKPLEWKANDIDNINLYSMVVGKRINYVPDKMPIFGKLRIIILPKILSIIHDVHSSYLKYKS